MFNQCSLEVFCCFSFLKPQHHQGSTCVLNGKWFWGISGAGIDTAQWPVMQQYRFNLVLGTVEPQIEICRLILAKSLLGLRDLCSPSHLWGVENLGDPLWATYLGNFHCDNCFWAPAETRCLVQSRSRRYRKRVGVPSSIQKDVRLILHDSRGVGLTRVSRCLAWSSLVLPPLQV